MNDCKNVESALLKIATHYGYEKQARMLQEECAELIQAVNKLSRKPSRETLKGMLEEMADVTIMIKQIKLLLDCDDGVAVMIAEKIDRQLKRIEAENKNDE